MSNQQPENVIHNQLVTLSKNLNMTNIDTGQMYNILKQTVFKGANDEQLAALMLVSNQYGLNPFTKEIYAFPSRGAITPIVSIDGWARIINNNPMLDGIQFEQDAESCTCKIYRKDRAHPTIITEWLDECRGKTDVWNKYPKRMLRHKALIQCARVAFGFSGIYDEDEARRIDEGVSAQATRIIDSQADDGYIEFYNDMLPNLETAASHGMDALNKAYKFLISLDNKEFAKRLWTEQSANLKLKAQQADIDTQADNDDIIDAEVVENESLPTE